jgi:hypothetical protein
MIGWRSATVRVAVIVLALCGVSIPATAWAAGHQGGSNRAVELTSPRTTPYFPPFTHFVIIVREGHTFDDYLGDCAKTIQPGCNGRVYSKNHIKSVPELHKLVKTYALLDHYKTGTQPPSGPNHWWLFSAQSTSHSQQQSYPSAHGTVFDRFLKGPTGSFSFIMDGDFYRWLKPGSGYWRNPATKAVEVLPIDRPGTKIPEEINYNDYTCCHKNVKDETIANDYIKFVQAQGLPNYSFVELFNDHPGTYQTISANDKATGQIVSYLMSNPAYSSNTMIVVTEDDTQNGANGSDHVSNTYRVPLVVIGSPKYMKQHYISHEGYSMNNVLAAMERVMQNVHPGIISSTGSITPLTFPMTKADQAALSNPLEDVWIQPSQG